ncbi:MAG: protein kinase [Planctomycetes bacterium]|nr:protein kinase [Planctomycetota bacterium]
MSTEHEKVAEQLFIELADAGSATRQRRLDEACADNSSLRDEVLSLLGHHDAAGVEFLDSNVLRGITAKGIDNVLPAETRIAGYTIQGVLGQGGMGIVYLARQERPRRVVALKVIRRASASPSLVRRFEHEAEVLGRLQHPGIAQIYEAGQADAGLGPQPFISMEFIRGKPLGEFCRTHNLPPRERMALVALVCDAVHHAHQRGVIHRDIKPSNVLVDESGQPKVLDFGVARDAEKRDIGVTLHTGVGELIGTLPYMSPEQVGGKPEDIDTRTDVYSLGVVLFELLADRLPHNLAGLSLPDAARKVREDEPTRLSSISRVLRGDVDTIVSKALDRNVARRYQSAADFAADIRRYLAGEPIAAKADSAMYVLRKQLNRYRGAVVGAGLSVLVLVVLCAYIYKQSLDNAALARNEAAANAKSKELLESVRATEKIAQKHAAEAVASEKEARSQLAISNVEQGRLFARTGNLEQAEQLIWRQHAEDPSSRYTYWALWEMYSRAPCLASALAEPGDLYTLTMSRDGTQVATGGAGSHLHLWRQPFDQPRLTLPVPDRGQRGAVFSPDGSRVICLSDSGAIHCWETATGSLVWCGHCGAKLGAFSIAWSPNGATFALGLRTGLLTLYIAETGVSAGSTRAFKNGSVYAMAFSPDSTMLAVVGSDTVKRLYRVADLSLIASISAHEQPPGCVDWSPDGSLIASGGYDRTVHIWDWNAGTTFAVLNAPNGPINSVQWLASGELLTTGWQTVDTWDPLRAPDPSVSRVSSIHLRETPRTAEASADGSAVAVGYTHGGMGVFERRVHPEVRRFKGGSGRTLAAISHDASILAAGDSDGYLRLFDTGRPGATPIATIKAHAKRVFGVRFQPQGHLIATGDESVLRLWDLNTGELVTEWNDFYNGSADAINFSADGKTIAYCSTTGVFLVREVATGKLELSLKPSPISGASITLSRDGSRIAMASRDRSVYLCSADGQLLNKATFPDVPSGLTFSHDSKLLAVSTAGKPITLLSAVSGVIVGVLDGHTVFPAGICFMPDDDDTLASVSHDGTARLWDTKAMRCLTTLEPFEGWEGLNASVSGNGRFLAAGYALGGAVIIDLDYYKRHMAGNARFQAQRLEKQMGNTFNTSALTDWTATLSRPRPQQDAPADGPSISLISRWGRER